jgi:hypothetical protein
MKDSFVAGAACSDITPRQSVFLFGYPHTERMSTGVHDPLLCSALYLGDHNGGLLFISLDVIYVDKALVLRTRQQIHQQTGIRENAILIAATHTHSGPVTVDCLCTADDAVVPNADTRYRHFLVDSMIRTAVKAISSAKPVVVGLVFADSRGIGSNRHDPDREINHQVPVLVARDKKKQKNIACLLVVNIHPTVLHEDSRLISADFPGMARVEMQRTLGAECTIVYYTGPCGNTSPRHMTRSNTFAEARRLGALLAESVIGAVKKIDFTGQLNLASRQTFINLPPRRMMSIDEAKSRLTRHQKRLQALINADADSREIRTAECDLYGAEETLTLSRAATEERLDAVVHTCLPAEIQVFTIGDWNFIGWPGEIFVEYAFSVQERHANAFVISLANGELQGYIVTAEEAERGGYEASNALFDYRSGPILVRETLALLNKI